MDSKEIYDQVNKRYSSINNTSTGKYEQTVAKAFGYTEEELVGVPEGANLGLSCGNPLALAKLRKAETVVDLGSGAGFDVFMAAKMVGPSGQAIGVDMNKTMLEKANAIMAKTNVENVKFIEATITSIPLSDNGVDCIISNCVINLVPEAKKQLVFNEMYRLLKPGGRVAISDILARKRLTEDMKKNIALYVGCISGASQVSEYEMYLKKAGFSDILIIDSRYNLNIYFTAVEDTVTEKSLSCCSVEKQPTGCKPVEEESGTLNHKEETSMVNEAKNTQISQEIMDFNEWAGSFKIYAVKGIA